MAAPRTLRLLGAQTSIGSALKGVATKFNIAVEEVDAANATKGLYVAAPLPFAQQLELVKNLQLHSKVVTASNRLKGSAYYGVSVTSVTNLANYGALREKLALFETYSKARFPEAGNRQAEIKKELAARFAETALVALQLGAQSGGSVGVVTKSAGKFNPLFDQILWEAVESLVKSDKRFEKVGVSNVRAAQAINKLITNPEKLSVVVSTPEEDSQRIADIVVGLGGGNAVVPVDYQGQDSTVFTASTNSSNSPVASFLALARYLSATGRQAEATKISNAVDAHITEFLAASAKGEEVGKKIYAAIQ